MDVPVVTGYFRYTDIWFEWHRALPNPEDGNPLKAIIARDALTHPEHPLRKPGHDGIELYIGTLAATGESRLLFSSAQIDYVRYWLHAMQLTKEIIPLPYSECLLTASDLRTVSPRIFKDGPSLRKAEIDKNNKRLKGVNATLSSRRDIFERVRTLWAAKVGIWCSVDFEAWDRDHTLLTEFGWSLVGWENGEEFMEKGHLIVTERRGYHNTYVAQWRDNYNFGASEDVDKQTFRARIHELFTRIRKNGPLFLVFHDSKQDIKYLNSAAISAPIGGLDHILPDAVPADGIFAIDTADMFAALEGEGAPDKRALGKVCHLLKIPVSFLHNAGNDAHYTLLAMRAMASGDPVDTQRDTRWPPKPDAPKTLKVQFTPWEEDSDYSDMEGIMPPISGYNPVTGDLIGATVTDEGEN